MSRQKYSKIPNNRGDLEANKFTPDSFDDVNVRVLDVDGHLILSAILAALGGSMNTTPTINNEVIAAANTEQSFIMPANTKKFILRNRSNNDLKFSYSLNGTTTSWLTIKKGAVFTDINFYTLQTLYFQSPNVGDVIEITTYA